MIDRYLVFNVPAATNVEWWRLKGEAKFFILGAAGDFSSPELTLCADSYSVRSTPVLPQWHVKDPGHSAKSAGGRLHLHTPTLWTQRNRSGLTMPPSRHSVGTYP